MIRALRYSPGALRKNEAKSTSTLYQNFRKNTHVRAPKFADTGFPAIVAGELSSLM